MTVINEDGVCARAGESQPMALPLLKSLLLAGLLLFPNLEGLPVGFLIWEAIPFLCGMYALSYPVPGTDERRVGSLCSQEPHFLCFHFSLQKCQPNQLFLFLDLGCGRPHSRNFQQTDTQGLRGLALGWPVLGGGLFEWIQTQEKTSVIRNRAQVVARVKSASDTSLPCFSTADQA